jgi:hypothetical protein
MSYFLKRVEISVKFIVKQIKYVKVFAIIYPKLIKQNVIQKTIRFFSSHIFS